LVETSLGRCLFDLLQASFEGHVEFRWITNVEVGYPGDAPMLEPVLARIKARVGRAPHAVTTDRGYGEADVEEALPVLGVRYVVLPKRANRAAPCCAWS
jgi:IS5 family transposase